MSEVRRADRERESLVILTRTFVMHRKVGRQTSGKVRPARNAGLQRVSVCGVYGHQLAGRQRRQEDLGQQRVTEPVGPIPHRLHDSSIDGLTQQNRHILRRDR
jgi:hypothetical protein